MNHYLARLLRVTKQCTDHIVHLVWNSNSGTWQWLGKSSRPLVALNKALWRDAVPSLNFYLLLLLSSLICTLGLLGDSTAVIIGAMIITPLLNPTIGIAFSLSVGNRRLFKRAGLTLVTGFFVAMVTSIIVCNLVGLQNLSSEILQRSQPTLLDLGVAMASGVAGAFATSRVRVGSALPGVAISVALLPPISVTGIGFSLGDQEIAWGALLLFLANLCGIILCGSLVFLLEGYGSIGRAKSHLIISIAILCLLGIPLGFSFRQLLINEQANHAIRSIVYQQYTNQLADIRRIDVDPQPDHMNIFAEIVAPEGIVTNADVEQIASEVEERLNIPVSLRLRVIPSYDLNNSSFPDLVQPKVDELSHAI